MGTHPSGPARVSDSDELLLDWLSKRSSAVGKVPKHYTGNDLPFMFKVLSVQTALSIQVYSYLNIVFSFEIVYLVIVTLHHHRTFLLFIVPYPLSLSFLHLFIYSFLFCATLLTRVVFLRHIRIRN